MIKKTFMSILTVTLAAAMPIYAQRTAADQLKQCEAANERGNYAKAIDHCSRAIQLDPTLEDPYMIRALIYKRQGKLDAAIADQTRLIELTSGFTMFLVYRAELYLLQNKIDLALADVNRAIGRKPDGLYGARAYYYRGTIMEGRGDKAAAAADYETAVRLRPTYFEAKERLAKIKPPATSLPRLPSLPTPAVVPPAAIPAPAAATGWKRLELTGTGLSVESPKPYELKQNEPDPLSETESAHVFWSVSFDGLWGTVRYIRSTDGKTPRQSLENTVKYIAASKTAVANVVDAAFLGQPAVRFEEEYVDTYDPNKTKKKRRMIAFGTSGEVTTIQFTYPAADPAMALTAEQIFSSFQKQGAVIKATPKMPPANWQYVQFHGLQFETPNPTPQTDCRHFPDRLLAASTKVCYEWDKLSIITINYSRYHAGRPVPAVAQLAQQRINGYKEQKKESTLNTLEEYSTVPVTIPGAEAIRVKIYTGYGTTGTRSEITFIKRGSEIWEFRTWEAMRWQYTSDAVKRITASLKF